MIQRIFLLFFDGRATVGESTGLFLRLLGLALPRHKKDWEVFAHYSGHQSFTKGLLLVDNSGGPQRQALEITARDCQWRKRKGQEWIAVQNGDSLSVREGQNYVSSFVVARKDGPKGHWPVDLTPPVWIQNRKMRFPNIHQYSGLVWNLMPFLSPQHPELQVTTTCT